VKGALEFAEKLQQPATSHLIERAFAGYQRFACRLATLQTLTTCVKTYAAAAARPPTGTAIYRLNRRREEPALYL